MCIYLPASASFVRSFILLRGGLHVSFAPLRFTLGAYKYKEVHEFFSTSDAHF